MFGIMAKTQGTRAFMFWIVTFGMIYITGMTLSCVSGYYLPLDLCDFYFEGHRECAPIFDASSTKSNITFPAVRDLVQRVVLQDGTVLTPSDGSIHFLESKRCVTIFTAPGAHLSIQHITTPASNISLKP
jgi:hypothetical protein